MTKWIVWIIAAWNTLALGAIWVSGYFNGWRSVVNWNNLHEGYVEGVFLGLMLVTLVIVYVRMLKGRA